MNVLKERQMNPTLNETESGADAEAIGLIICGGGVPGVALDAERVELPEFTSIHDGGHRSCNGRLRWGSRCRAGNDSLRRRKENQDALCINDVLNGDVDTTFFSVFDGHGPNGAFVSHFVRDLYHRAVAEAYAMLILERKCKSVSDNDINALNQKTSVASDVMTEVFRQAAQKVVDELNASGIDSSVSGTTALAMLVHEKDIIIANIGDSRAVVAKFSEELQRYELHCETKDHNPDVPEECARIEISNGRVFEWGTPRVWLQDTDMPGLAMSRSFGDLVAKTIGVIAEPDVLRIEIEEFCTCGKKQRPSHFAILASDGIWEFISTDECVQFVAACIFESEMSPQETCIALVDEACSRWDVEEDVIDDITAVIVYF
ncbi:hypothetical protein CCR75_009536 [Bremia lactucae]|uniref:PPM-type phosphatase domain-containing protein n=1 Tax=Bremia lactucae TaxID=4779 RepID=A0A976IGK6_BRELC|nr:hypothetical protein CCR75_009536 [Bremia lactucae]